MKNGLRVPHDWRVKGAAVVRLQGQALDSYRETGICEHCQAPCGHDFFRFEGGQSEYEQVEERRYSIVADGTTIAQDIVDAGHAQLMGLAARMALFVQRVAAKNPLVSNEYDAEECRFCGETPDEFPGQPKFTPHKRECIWRLAKEIEHDLAGEPPWGGSVYYVATSDHIP